MPEFKYKIISELNLIIDCYSGILTLKDVLMFKGEQTKNSLWNPTYNTLADMRQSNIQFSEEEIQKLANYQITDERWSSERKTASLTNDAGHIVFETMFNLLKPKNSKVGVRAFSTLEASLNWLNIDLINMERISDILAELNPDHEP